MPAERDQYDAYARSTGPWPGRDHEPHRDGPEPHRAEATAVLPPPEPATGLPWPEYGPDGGTPYALRAPAGGPPYGTDLPPSPVGPSPTPPRRRWRLPVAAVATLLALTTGGVAVAALRPDGDTDRPAGEIPQAGQSAPAAGAPTPSGGLPSPSAASPSAAERLGGRPAGAPPSAPAGSTKGFTGARLTLPGASIGVQPGENFNQALQRTDRTFGRLQMARVFYPGLPPAWKGSRSDAVDRTVVVSFKAAPAEINSGKHDSRLAAWFASIPREHNVYWSYFHEPEDDVERGAFTPQAYRNAWKRVAGLAERAGNPKLVNTLILMCWTLDPKSGRSFDAFYPGSGVIETLGWDCYNWGAKWKRYAPPQEIYGRMIEKSRTLGKPWGLAETGSDLVPGDSGGGRAAWLRSMTSFVNGQRPEFVAYYNQVVEQGDFRLRDQPSIQAWKTFNGA